MKKVFSIICLIFVLSGASFSQMTPTEAKKVYDIAFYTLPVYQQRICYCNCGSKALEKTYAIGKAKFNGVFYNQYLYVFKCDKCGVTKLKHVYTDMDETLANEVELFKK